MPQATIDPLLRHKQNQVCRALSGREVYETAYHPDTPDRVCEVLELHILERNSRRHTGNRIRLYYGDTATGRSWLDEWGMEGYVSRSMGPIHVPILLPNSISNAGGPILDHCIVKIRTTQKPYRVLYQHPTFHVPEMHISSFPEHVAPGLPEAVLVEGEVHARFKSWSLARAWIEKME